MTRTILVTGGAGYVGSHACKLLAAAGFEPVTYDNLERGHRELVRWGPLEQGDLRNRDHIERACKHYRPGAVMHFAALAYVGESVEKPDLYREVNVGGGRNLLRAMTAAKVPRIVFSSTCATYGDPQAIPMTEDHPQAPINPYGETKLEMEEMIGRWAGETAGQGVLLRYFNAAGADPGGHTGEWHEPETHLLPLALQAAAGDLERLTVYGDDYPTPDGTCVRDYIHVTDLAEAHLLALEFGAGKGATTAFNLGNGQGFSVAEVIAAVERVTGQEVPREIGPRRPGDPPELVADATRARTLLGWNPRLAGLDDIIGTAWAWHKQMFKG